MLEAAAVQATPRERVGAMIGQVLSGRGIDPAALRGVAQDVLASLGLSVNPDALPKADFYEMLGRVAADLRQRRAAAGSRPPPPPPRDPAAARLAEVRQAMLVMGFDPSSTVDEAQIKARRRDLARKHHPDRGGSVETAQRINAAADILLAHVGAGGVGSEAHGR